MGNGNDGVDGDGGVRKYEGFEDMLSIVEYCLRWFSIGWDYLSYKDWYFYLSA